LNHGGICRRWCAGIHHGMCVIRSTVYPGTPSGANRSVSGSEWSEEPNRAEPFARRAAQANGAAGRGGGREQWRLVGGRDRGGGTNDTRSVPARVAMAIASNQGWQRLIEGKNFAAGPVPA
jgi:hypothetical protein